MVSQKDIQALKRKLEHVEEAVARQVDSDAFANIAGFVSDNKYTAETYNGWYNYETWNVALWIGNEEKLYDALLFWIHSQLANDVEIEDLKYHSFIHDRDYDYFGIATTFMDLEKSNGSGRIQKETPDAVSWDDPKLRHQELDRMVQEMAADDYLNSSVHEGGSE
tara:strand:+ start:108 stop:602 length:495 start_codon:yes stop_codon:yes gene_type:complete